METYNDKILMEDDIYDLMLENEDFKVFITKCILHFTEFRLKWRDNDEQVDETYPVPDIFEEQRLSDAITFERKPNAEKILVKWVIW